MQSDKQLTRPGSHPVRFELVSYRGEIFGPYSTMTEAVEVAKEKWPHQRQDEDRAGLGWDIQAIEAA